MDATPSRGRPHKAEPVPIDINGLLPQFMPKKQASSNDVSKLPALKDEYFALAATLLSKTNEIYWKQGKLLLQIKQQVEHGKWLKWIKENLNLDRAAAQERMAIGSLDHLPKKRPGTLFEPGIHVLAAVAVIAKKEQLTPEAAFAKWEKQTTAANGKPYINKSRDSFSPPPRIAPRAMSSRDALLALGIDAAACTVTAETLEVIKKGLFQIHHPDKGGTNARFVTISKALEVLGSK